MHHGRLGNKVIFLVQGTSWFPSKGKSCYVENYQFRLYSGLLQSMKGSPESSPTSFVDKELFSWEEERRRWLGALPKTTQPGRMTQLGLLSPRFLLIGLYCIDVCYFKRVWEGSAQFENIQMLRPHDFSDGSAGALCLTLCPEVFHDCIPLSAALIASNSFLWNYQSCTFQSSIALGPLYFSNTA